MWEYVHTVYMPRKWRDDIYKSLHSTRSNNSHNHKVYSPILGLESIISVKLSLIALARYNPYRSALSSRTWLPVPTWQKYYEKNNIYSIIMVPDKIQCNQRTSGIHRAMTSKTVIQILIELCLTVLWSKKREYTPATEISVDIKVTSLSNTYIYPRLSRYGRQEKLAVLLVIQHCSLPVPLIVPSISAHISSKIHKHYKPLWSCRPHLLLRICSKPTPVPQVKDGISVVPFLAMHSCFNNQC